MTRKMRQERWQQRDARRWQWVPKRTWGCPLLFRCGLIFSPQFRGLTTGIIWSLDLGWQGPLSTGKGHRVEWAASTQGGQLAPCLCQWWAVTVCLGASLHPHFLIQKWGQQSMGNCGDKWWHVCTCPAWGPDTESYISWTVSNGGVFAAQGHMRIFTIAIPPPLQDRRGIFLSSMCHSVSPSLPGTAGPIHLKKRSRGLHSLEWVRMASDTVTMGRLRWDQSHIPQYQTGLLPAQIGTLTTGLREPQTTKRGHLHFTGKKRSVSVPTSPGTASLKGDSEDKMKLWMWNTSPTMRSMHQCSAEQGPTSYCPEPCSPPYNSGTQLHPLKESLSNLRMLVCPLTSPLEGWVSTVPS